MVYSRELVVRSMKNGQLLDRVLSRVNKLAYSLDVEYERK